MVCNGHVCVVVCIMIFLMEDIHMLQCVEIYAVIVLVVGLYM